MDRSRENSTKNHGNIYNIQKGFIHGVFEMVDFETIKSEEIRFGTNNFLEVARKKAISDDQENEFLQLTRGYFTPDEEKRYKKNFSVPINKEIVDFIAKKLPEMLEEEE